MSAHSGSGTWVPLMEFAAKNGVSLSTLRRHIKSGKVIHKLVSGKYFLFDEEPVAEWNPTSQLDTLKQDLNKAHEEIAELKTLIALYEESSHPVSAGR